MDKQNYGGKRSKLGLYSITFAGIWYRGNPLTLEELIERARKYGYDGIEIDGKRPHGNPLDMPKSRCRELRSLADGQGIEIHAVAANNDFSSPIPEHRECQILYLRELIQMTADLGAKILRVFLAWPGVTRHPQIGQYSISKHLWAVAHQQFSAEETWAWCRDGLVESARYAGEEGVTLALQYCSSHRRSSRRAANGREVNSPHLKVCLDSPMMPDKSPETIRQAALDVGSLQVLSHFGGEYRRAADGHVKGEDFYRDFVERCGTSDTKGI